jgi:fatty acid desaturase
MKTSPYDTYWNEAENWKWRLIYVCKEDPRVIVPKKPKWAGRTLNFAHRKSFLVLFLTILAVAIPLALHGHISNVIWWILFSIIIAGIIVFYYCFELSEK